jgi:peptidoglycan-associated lipoprotein
MKKRFIVTVISSALLIVGCAEKEISTVGVDDKANGVDYSSINSNNHDDTKYENVDLYDRESGGGYSYNSGYNEGANGGIKNIYFATDQYHITSDKLHIIRNNAKVLSPAVNSGSRVKIEGHCDATGTDEYNYALGLRRAKATKDATVSAGIRPSSITVVSMGESSPECTTGYSSACYAKNRRVEFKVIR